MPKVKTHKGAKKRFKITKNKKIMYSKAYRGHILTKKSAKRKRGLRKPGRIQSADQKRIKNLMPYDF